MWGRKKRLKEKLKKKFDMDWDNIIKNYVLVNKSISKMMKERENINDNME